MPVQVPLVKCGEYARNTHVPNPLPPPRLRVRGTADSVFRRSFRGFSNQLCAKKGNLERPGIVRIYGSSAIPLRLADSSVVEAVIGKLDSIFILNGERRSSGVRV